MTEPARLITEAELALIDREYADAAMALQQHAATGRLQIATIRLQLRAAQGLGQWREVARLARQLEKYRGMTADQTRPIRTRARLENLLRILRDGEPVATIEQMCLHVDMKAGKTCAAAPEVLAALRGDHWMHSAQNGRSPLRQNISKTLRDAFYFDAPHWQAAVYGRMADFVVRASRVLADP